MANRDGGQVDVRFSVSNAEVVRQALQALGKDGEKALKQFDNAAKPVPRTMALVGKGIDEAKAQAQTFAGQLGPVGRLLTSVGPSGLVAAGAAGAVTMAFYKASQAASQFADDMLKIRDAAETVGLSTLQLQGLFDEGSKFQLGEDRLNQVLQRFSSQMEEFRRGQGELFDLVRRIDPALAREMALARDTAAAIDVLARVYERAGDARSRLDRMIGGRQGGSIGLWLQEIGRQGGVQRVTDEFEKSGDAINRHMIDRVAQLKADIDDMAGDARRNIASIFSVQILETQHTFVSSMRELSRTMKEFSVSGDWRDLIAKLSDDGVLDNVRRFAVAVPAIAGLVNGTITVAERFGRRGNISISPTAAPQVEDLPMPRSRPAGEDRAALELALNLERQRVAALGSSASATERLAIRKRELELAVRSNVISQADYNRALGVSGLEAAIQMESRRIGILGDMVRIDDLVLQKQREINLARSQGARITAEESEEILKRTRLQAEYSRLEGPRGQLMFEREQIFRSDMEATIAARLRAAGEEIDFNSATAQAIRLNEQLKFGKDLASDFASGLARDIRNGTNVLEAFGSALNRIADKLMDMAVNDLVGAAFGAGRGGGGLGSLFSGLFGGGGGGGFAMGAELHTGGIVGIDGKARFVHPAYFENANRFARGGIAGLGPDEVPIIAHRNEEIIRRDDPRHRANGGGASGAVVNNFIVENHTGSRVEERKERNDSGGIDHRVIIRQEVNQGLANGDFSAALNSRQRAPTRATRRG